MSFQLTDEQEHFRKSVQDFVKSEILPYAEQWDRQESTPREIVKKLSDKGLLCPTIPKKYGGLELDQVRYGILHEEIGRGCSSVRSLLTVHSSLTAETISRWGNEAQKQQWLPKLCKGEKVAAFGLSEPTTGSDAQNVQTTYTQVDGGYVLNGHKKWITFSQMADLFVIVAKGDQGVCAFLVESVTEGCTVNPLTGMLGTKASMLGEIILEDCFVPEAHLLGRPGFGFAQIVNTALDNGRFSVACGSLGIARACLEDSVAYAKERQQFGSPIKDHQLIKQKITNMITEVKAARLLCYNAAHLRATKNPDSFIQTTVAKYYTTQAANRIASEAVQLHGAAGCHDSRPIQRYFRDAKIMEIIEGSSEIQQILIANQGLASLSSILS
ncbi:acyl-CoA dehydrogenase family protein [Luteibaculum oceani]|uniref:Acyl-CoA dehydrogenase n=1 Tax=Luteibaculum oceani TaxID=1294296 RepID=A0A5C6VFA7_9FLAO|nr:acyl-CoA dehydrogenase family protein [Luteibaculum oceani]TXC81938.1 acyl-CoA dehydrogenase [Luteibaculum oceani]